MIHLHLIHLQLSNAHSIHLHHSVHLHLIKKKLVLLIAAALLFFCLPGASLRAEEATDWPLSRTGFFFDTVVTVSLYGPADEPDSSSAEDSARLLLDECFERMAEYEDLFSRTKEGSDVWNINHSNGKATTVSEETAALIRSAAEVSELTQGAFDITIAPAAALWDFSGGEDPSLPDEKELLDAVSHIDYQQIRTDGNQVTLTDPDASIDLGGIAKGYISDVLRDLIEERGCSAALINLGGNVMTVGTKSDKTPWRIGIRRPFGNSDSDLACVVEADRGCVITSGSYERYFEKDGVLYHHILDPDTGYPVQNHLVSVSILTEDGTLGDALSTSCFILGEEEGLALAESLEGTEALFITDTGKQIHTSGWR